MSNPSQSIDSNDFSAFLMAEGWGAAECLSLGGADLGGRHYYRLTRGNETVLLMLMNHSGYEAGLEAYLDIAEFLVAQGVHAPKIYAVDKARGWALIEDFGGISFGDALKRGENPEEIYKLATDVLIQIRKTSTQNVLKLGNYSQTLIRDRLKQFVDYYMPAILTRDVTAEDHAEFQNVWAEIEKSLSPCLQGVCHADYHLENLMWKPDTSEKYGLIDFQDAFWGALPYDLLNLLEDARQSVPEEIKAVMKARYCEGMSASERRVFDDWYVVLSAHFHCRVLGLFIKFSQEGRGDQKKVEAFLAHIPRLQGYMRKNLENPVLAPLKEWVEKKGISFDVTPNLRQLS